MPIGTISDSIFYDFNNFLWISVLTIVYFSPHTWWDEDEKLKRKNQHSKYKHEEYSKGEKQSISVQRLRPLLVSILSDLANLNLTIINNEVYLEIM